MLKLLKDIFVIVVIDIVIVFVYISVSIIQIASVNGPRGRANANPGKWILQLTHVFAEGEQDVVGGRDGGPRSRIGRRQNSGCL